MGVRTVIIGGGAAGMLCAALSASGGADVTLVERNEKLGKKLYITGKGRCNFTNCCSPSEFLNNVVTNPRFLYSAVSRFSPDDVMELFESWGLRTKVERGRRAFPASDRSADVCDMLRSALRKAHVRVLLNTRAVRVLAEDGGVTGVEVLSGDERQVIPCEAAVVATGGITYPSTGSTGDGYRFAKECGHTVEEPVPSLVPIVCREEYIREMQGLSLKNVRLTFLRKDREIFSDFGEMMFTHFGITGPIVLSASAMIGRSIGDHDIKARIDLKPALTEEEFDHRLVRLFSENPNRDFKNVLGELYPAKMHAVIPELSGLDPSRKLRDITREERRAIAEVTKNLPVTPTALRGRNEAVVTKGGVSVKEVRPGTMESKLVNRLYFIGEVLDVDAFTGGYNLQIAWSTAASCAGDLNARQ